MLALGLEVLDALKSRVYSVTVLQTGLDYFARSIVNFLSHNILTTTNFSIKIRRFTLK